MGHPVFSNRRNTTPQMKCVVSETASTVFNDTTIHPVDVTDTEIVIPDVLEVKRPTSSTYIDNPSYTNMSDVAVELPNPDMFNVCPDLSAELNITDILDSSELKPAQGSNELCFTKPICQKTVQELTQEQFVPDGFTSEFSTPDFSTSLFTDLPIVSWDTAIQEYKIPASTQNVFTATTAPRFPASINCSKFREDSLISCSFAFQNIHCNNAPDALKSASVCQLSVLPTVDDMFAFNKSSAPAHRSCPTPFPDENGVTPCGVKSRVMMRLPAPIKKAGHTTCKRGIEYQIVGSDIPHENDNRKVRKQLVAKEKSVSMAAGDEIAMQRESILRELDEKRQRTRNWLGKNSGQVYMQSSAYFEKEQRRKKKSLYTTLFLKQATKSAKLVDPVALATVSMTTPVPIVGQRCPTYQNHGSIISENMTSTKNSELNSNHNFVVPAKVAVADTCHVSPQSPASLEKIGSLVLKLCKNNTTWTSRRAPRPRRHRS